MGFFDFEPFDLNHDGKVDFIERALEFEFMQELEREQRKREREMYGSYDDEDDEEDY